MEKLFITSILFLQLEERIDTLSKEARAHKTATEAAQILIGELREELQQVSSVRSSYKVHLSLNASAVRVAEWSKAPDSRVISCPLCGFEDFWSTYVGVGSNPTSDKFFLLSTVTCSLFSSTCCLTSGCCVS